MLMVNGGRSDWVKGCNQFGLKVETPEPKYNPIGLIKKIKKKKKQIT